MHKKCPYCLEETFGWRELVTLDSFTPKQCRNCHKFVRNSGWRQLLAPLTFISIILAALPLLESIPSEKSVLLIPVAVIVLPLVLVLMAKPVKSAMESPPILTAKLSGRRRRPPHVAHGTADIYWVSHSR